MRLHLDEMLDHPPSSNHVPSLPSSVPRLNVRNSVKKSYFKLVKFASHRAEPRTPWWHHGTYVETSTGLSSSTTVYIACQQPAELRWRESRRAGAWQTLSETHLTYTRLEWRPPSRTRAPSGCCWHLPGSARAPAGVPLRCGGSVARRPLPWVHCGASLLHARYGPAFVPKALWRLSLMPNTMGACAENQQRRPKYGEGVCVGQGAGCMRGAVAATTQRARGHSDRPAIDDSFLRTEPELRSRPPARPSTGPF
jgi:hypothetical protein